MKSGAPLVDGDHAPQSSPDLAGLTPSARTGGSTQGATLLESPDPFGSEQLSAQDPGPEKSWDSRVQASKRSKRRQGP